MDQNNQPSDPLVRTSELVGRWMYYFSRLEEQLNAAITTLFKLDDATADIITANVDFFRKVSIVHSAVTEQNASPDEEWLRKEIKETFVGIAKINDERQVIAHSSFEPASQGGVQFKRSVARGKLNRQDPHWSETKFSDEFDAMQKLERELTNVLRHIQPYVPKLDFSDPRNSMFVGMLE